MIVDLALEGYGLGCLPAGSVKVRPRMNVLRIQREVARFYEITLTDMLSSRRKREVCRPRQVAMYFAHKLLPISYPDLGRRFNRDHTTAIYAVGKVEELIDQDEEFAADIETLWERFGG